MLPSDRRMKMNHDYPQDLESILERVQSQRRWLLLLRNQ